MRVKQQMPTIEEAIKIANDNIMKLQEEYLSKNPEIEKLKEELFAAEEGYNIAWGNHDKAKKDQELIRKKIIKAMEEYETIKSEKQSEKVV
jgi:hypothetical protein